MLVRNNVNDTFVLGGMHFDGVASRQLFSFSSFYLYPKSSLGLIRAVDAGSWDAARFRALLL